MRISFNPNISRNHAKNLNFGAIGKKLQERIENATIQALREHDITNYDEFRAETSKLKHENTLHIEDIAHQEMSGRHKIDYMEIQDNTRPCNPKRKGRKPVILRCPINSHNLLNLGYTPKIASNLVALRKLLSETTDKSLVTKKGNELLEEIKEHPWVEIIDEDAFWKYIAPDSGLKEKQ